MSFISIETTARTREPLKVIIFKICQISFGIVIVTSQTTLIKCREQSGCLICLKCSALEVHLKLSRAIFNSSNMPRKTMYMSLQSGERRTKPQFNYS